MATQNITITEGGWQDLITLGSLTLTQGDTYTITIYSNGQSEVCIADSKPEDTFRGHGILEEAFSFIYTGDKIWVKLSKLRPNVATVVFS